MDEHASGPHQTRHRHILLKVLAGCGFFVLVLVGLLIFLVHRNSYGVAIPRNIAKNLSFDTYMPRQLPGNYKIDDNSYTADLGVLMFQAGDGVDGTLTFTEQQRPKDINFGQLYKELFSDGRTLSDVPYPSVWGKTKDDRLALSIVSNKTWILMTSDASLKEDDMQRIVQGLHP